MRLPNLSCLAALLLAAGAAAVDRPNFIVVLTDGQGWGDAGFQGHPDLRTPTLDEMAAGGLVFDHFYAMDGAAQTRSTILTGRHHVRTGVVKSIGPINPDEVTVADALADAGYATAWYGLWQLSYPKNGGSYVKLLHRNAKEIFKQGDEYKSRYPAVTIMRDAPFAPSQLGFEHTFGTAIVERDFNPLHMVKDGTFWGRIEGGMSGILVEDAKAWINEQVDGSKPFLACLWFQAGSAPHQHFGPWYHRYGDKSREEAFYYAELSEMDEALGDLRAHLRKLGVAENTLIVFASDGGPDGGNQALARNVDQDGRRGEEAQEGPTRVLALAEWPGKITAGRVATPISTMDLYPTFLALAGIEAFGPERDIDGESFAGLFTGAGFERQAPIRSVNGIDSVRPDGSRGQFDDFVTWTRRVYVNEATARGRCQFLMKTHPPVPKEALSR